MTNNKSYRQSKVIIIGGGISGLIAAQKLSEYSVDYVLLEARPELGGRIQTNRDGIVPYDIGASWAHDTLTNPLFDEIIKDDINLKDYQLYYDDKKIFYFSEKHGPEFFENEKIEQVVNEIEKFIELKFFEEINKKDISLKEIIEEYLKKQGQLLNDTQINYAPQFARQLELWHGIGWDEMSAKFGLVDNVGRNCLFRSGYDRVIDKIIARLDSNKILTNCVVKKIVKNKEKVEITLSDGELFSSDWCICTIPQSLLQADKEEIGGIYWNPPLPDRIKDALDNMSWGKLGKIIFEFSEPWWKHLDTDRFVAISSPSGLEMGLEGQKTGLPKPWEFPVLILNMYRINDAPSLLCFMQGELTEYLERNPNKAWDYMKPILQKLSKSNDVEEPKNIIVSQWTVDPFSRGSYAACKPGNDPTDLVIQLSNGLGNIRFAGEHTILDGAGAVHGAWMSGIREAEYILIKDGMIEGEIDEW